MTVGATKIRLLFEDRALSECKEAPPTGCQPAADEKEGDASKGTRFT